MEAENEGILKISRSTKSKGKKPESPINLRIKSIMRGIKKFEDTLDLAEGLKKSDMLAVNSAVHILRSGFEDLLKKHTSVFQKFNDWD